MVLAIVVVVVVTSTGAGGFRGGSVAWYRNPSTSTPQRVLTASGQLLSFSPVDFACRRQCSEWCFHLEVSLWSPHQQRHHHRCPRIILNGYQDVQIITVSCHCLHEAGHYQLIRASTYIADVIFTNETIATCVCVPVSSSCTTRSAGQQQ